MSKYILLIILTVFTSNAYSQNWNTSAQIPADSPTRHHPVTFSLEGYGYVGTGTDNSFLYGDFYRYDPVEDSWEQIGNFPGPPRAFSYGDTANGKAYMGFGLGGGNTVFNDLWEFDPETESWTMLTPCPCTPRFHPAFVAEGDYIVVGFGANLQGNLSEFWQYQISTDTWEKIPDPDGFVRHHPFYFGINGKVYAGLGHGSNTITWNGIFTPIYNDWHVWEPGVSTEWTKLNDFPGEPRVAGQQFSHGGYGFVISGQGADHQNFQTGEFWQYDPVTDNWSELPPHPGTGRWAPGGLIADGKFFLYGGRAHFGTDKEDFDLRGDMIYFDIDAYLNNTSVQSNISSEGIVFPNPAKDMINLDIESDLQSYRIINITDGKDIKGYSDGSNSIDITRLAAGNYIIYAKDINDRISIGSFVKQ